METVGVVLITRGRRDPELEVRVVDMVRSRLLCACRDTVIVTAKAGKEKEGVLVVVSAENNRCFDWVAGLAVEITELVRNFRPTPPPMDRD